MLYTNTGSYFVYVFVKNLINKLKARPELRDAFEFSEIRSGHISKLGGFVADAHV